MLFRHLTLFRFPRSLRSGLEAIETNLPDAALKPVGPLELSSRGFVSPFGRNEEALSHRVGNCLLLTLGGEDRLLPTAVVNEALAKRVAQVQEREGRMLGGRERKRLKDEVLTDLLPRAFVRPSRTNAYLDLDRGWLVVDTSSRKTAEAMTTALREALGSFPALPANAESSPRALLTAWIAGEDVPDGFVVGNECELRDPVEQGAIVKCRRQELDGEEIAEMLKAGKQGYQLELTYEDRLSFVLGEDLVIRKLKFLETATESLQNDERDSLRAEIDAVFALMSGELGQLLDRLEGVMLLSQVDEDVEPLKKAA
jgi:recombination associated protein RdgC